MTQSILEGACRGWLRHAESWLSCAASRHRFGKWSADDQGKDRQQSLVVGDVGMASKLTWIWRSSTLDEYDTEIRLLITNVVVRIINLKTLLSPDRWEEDWVFQWAGAYLARTFLGLKPVLELPAGYKDRSFKCERDHSFLLGFCPYRLKKRR
jgi:hypothetical protein